MKTAVSTQEQAPKQEVGIVERVPIQLLVTIVMIGILLVVPAGSAFAQDGGAVGDAFTGIIETITGIIQSLTIIVGILGITVWGFGKVARPVFPEIAQMTNQYINGFLVGIVAVYVAATVVEELANAVSGAAG